jgi:hypothetical protein
MKHTAFATFLLSTILLGCGGDKSHLPIELDNGSKWQINSEMMPHLNASQQLVSRFATKKVDDYKLLAKELKANNEALIKSCTMTGKSHDELHKWLHPYMGMINDLSKVKTEEEGSQMLNKIKDSFEMFNQHFE